MKKSLYVLAAIVLSSMMLACSSDDSDGNSKTIMLRNHTESGCKDVASFSNTSSSGYQKVKSQFDSKIKKVRSLSMRMHRQQQTAYAIMTSIQK